jgi:VCBS repeat-containing protein
MQLAQCSFDIRGEICYQMGSSKTQCEDLKQVVELLKSFTVIILDILAHLSHFRHFTYGS